MAIANPYPLVPSEKTSCSNMLFSSLTKLAISPVTTLASLYCAVNKWSLCKKHPNINDNIDTRLDKWKLKRAFGVLGLFNVKRAFGVLRTQKRNALPFYLHCKFDHGTVEVFRNGGSLSSVPIVSENQKRWKICSKLIITKRSICDNSS